MRAEVAGALRRLRILQSDADTVVPERCYRLDPRWKGALLAGRTEPGEESLPATATSAAPASTIPAPAPAPPTPAQPILEWLEREGFRARLDEDGDVHLRHEGRDVFVVFDAEQRFFALTVANRLNASLKVAKISLRSDGATCVAVELFVNGSEALRAVLPRCLDLIGAATWEFRERMKEAMRKAAAEDAAMREFVEAEPEGAEDDGERP